MRPWIEPVCCAIVAVYLVGRIRRADDRRAFLARMACLFAGAWLVENSVIEAYGFYRYAPGWTLFVHHVPLMIAVIWPVVIHSAWDLAAVLLPKGDRRVPLVAAGFVLLDAALIEPIAVHAGLWHWTEPGLFGVPPIGILGWALFAFAAIGFLARQRATWLILLAPLATHAMLLALWWGLFRWISRPWPTEPAVAAILVITLALAAAIHRRALRRRVPPSNLMSRAPGAAFFFTLLALDAAPWSLVLYASAFAPPYLALLDPQQLRSPRPAE